MKQCRVNRYLAMSVVVLPLLLLAAGADALAQGNINAPSNREMRELLKVPGKVVSEAKSARATGNLKLTGYRIEEIQLPRSMTVEVQGRQSVVNKAWRVTINGGSFPVRALPAVVWIDDQIVGNGIENETLSQITAITFDGSLIRTGAVISISYGENKESRERVTAPIQLKGEGGNQ